LFFSIKTELLSYGTVDCVNRVFSNDSTKDSTGFIPLTTIDEILKTKNLDGFVKSSQARRANPEE